jgi:hypothetical protein
VASSDQAAAGDDTTAAAGADASAADSAAASQPEAAEAAGNGAGAGEQADTGPAQPFGGRRRRRAATREPGPPDMAAEPAGQTEPEASAAAGV